MVYDPEHSRSLVLPQRLPKAPTQPHAPPFRQPVVNLRDDRPFEEIALTEQDHEEEERGEDEVRA
jgi:hypothetical protein